MNICIVKYDRFAIVPGLVDDYIAPWAGASSGATTEVTLYVNTFLRPELGEGAGEDETAATRSTESAARPASLHPQPTPG